jgi:hypothetical protein
MKKFAIRLTLPLVGALLAGCTGNAPPPTGPTVTGPSPAGAKHLLAAEPAGAKPVIDVRKAAKDGDEVVVVGRIGGSAQPWIKGRAGFQIVDPSFKPCSEKGDDGCKTPWDYCCDPKGELVKGMATVKVVDAGGQTLPTDAKDLLGLAELDTVVVRGTAKRDEQGNLTVLAAGIHRRPATAKAEAKTP